MEHLNKQQLILLTLLVSFVTSIATGIVTVALMDQAPVGITQTIDRVVQNTIQTVTAPAQQTVVTKTVEINPDEQIVSAVANNSNSLIRIYAGSANPADTSAISFVGIGAVISDDGIIATDNSIIFSGNNYFITDSNGTLHNLSVLNVGSEGQIALLRMSSSSDEKSMNLFKVSIATSTDVKLGQTVIYIGGEKQNEIATGIVSNINTRNVQIANSTSTKAVISSIETSISSDFIPGGLLLNLSGQLIGIKSTYAVSSRTDLFAPASDIVNVISAISTSTAKNQ
jgi:hypothetical protein